MQKSEVREILWQHVQLQSGLKNKYDNVQKYEEKKMTLLTPKPSKYTSLIIIKLFYTIYKLHITELGKKKETTE